MNMAQPVEKSGQIRAVTRALTVLRVLSEKPEGLNLSETAAAAGLAASTAHRVLTTLEAERFVRFDQQTSCWQVGVGAFTTGAAFGRSRDVIGLARPYLRRLMEVTGETASVYLESGGEVVCMAQVESRHPMRTITRVGGRMKMHWSGAGKAILAHSSPEFLEAVIADHGLPKATPGTLTDKAALRNALQKAAEAGYSVDDEEHAPGVRCVAAAVLNENREPVAAISISGPCSRMTDARLPNLAEQVRRVAAEVTREFGGG